MSRDNTSKGLLKLMLKLPALRGELQIIHGHNKSLQDLTEAYNDATEMLAGLRCNALVDRTLLCEYELVCAEIETEVVGICALRGSTRR